MCIANQSNKLSIFNCVKGVKGVKGICVLNISKKMRRDMAPKSYSKSLFLDTLSTDSSVFADSLPVA